MAKTYEVLDAKLTAFIQRQKIFFTGSAPLQADGHINLSPKGMDSFLVCDEANVAFMNFTGSGNETAAHLLENGRLVIMFCSFDKTPLILRLYGRGGVVYPDAPDWPQWQARFGGADPGHRQVITMQISKVITSCGFGVPYYDYVGERSTLLDWGQRKGVDGVRQYALEYNVTSLDGLPTGLPAQGFPGWTQAD